ncbi:hypothetical protein GOC16_15775 [Sinorhizobium meliloti]|nr:hypothetical protein [Sinorhizobium meliloti]
MKPDTKSADLCSKRPCPLSLIEVLSKPGDVGINDVSASEWTDVMPTNEWKLERWEEFWLAVCTSIDRHLRHDGNACNPHLRNAPSFGGAILLFDVVGRVSANAAASRTPFFGKFLLE